MYRRAPAPSKLPPSRVRPFTAIPSFKLTGATPSFDASVSFCHRILRTVDTQAHIIEHSTLFTDVLNSTATVLSFSTANVKIFEVDGGNGFLLRTTFEYSG